MHLNIAIKKKYGHIYIAIRDEFNVKFGRKCKFFFRRIRKNWLYVLLNVIISACLIFLVAYPVTRNLFDYFIRNTTNKNISMWSDATILVAYIYLYAKYVLPKIIEINSGFKHFNKWMKNTFFTPDQDEVLGYKAEIKKNLDEVLVVWKKRIVLLVDELDRCNAEVISSFFDTVQLFQHSNNIQIVYAVDRKVLDRALIKKGLPSDEIESYLKKYIDYQINIYPINKELEVLDKIISQYEFTKNELIFIHTFIRKYLQVNITIRDLKEILNVLCETKGDWLSQYIYTKKYLNDDNYVISFKKYIPWAIYALTDSKWVSYMLEDIPSKSTIINNDDIETEFKSIISRNNLQEKYKECPKYLRESRILDIVYYKELIAKYKAV